MINKYSLFTTLLWLYSCGLYAQVYKTETLELEDVRDKISEFDNVTDIWSDTWGGNSKVYNPSFKRVNDILHVDLKLSFDFDKAYIFGDETLKVKAYNLPVDSLILDAKGMLIHEVALLQSNTKKALKYSYNAYQLKIALDKKYSRDEQYSIYIKYTARPNELAENAPELDPYERGAYFVRPSKYFKNKPLQVWTQGETEDNSVWFPLIDKPNERFTHTIALRVPDSLQTFSNGVKKSATPHPDKTRTDVWNMTHDNAAYLVAFVVGKYAVVKDKWNGKELAYYVEPAYEKSAKDIFAHTPEMLTFFSKKLGVPYPYQDYKQVVVRDYVSGAMENTGAVIFGEFVQHHSADLKFHSNEGIVAHEMFHHWFGNYVTCESWANLPLNESFANYSEYLWYEYKYGRFYADEKGYEEYLQYMDEAESKSENLIRYNYTDRRDMFDSHSYAKGGRILHMLRYYLGDETFFRGLNLYLTQNANKTVEVHNLRMAFEEVSGEDLNWFFNQWFLDKGHPSLDIDHEFNGNKLELKIYSITSLSDYSNYKLPFAIDFYLADGRVVRKQVELNTYDTTMVFEFDSEILNANFDAEKVLLASIYENKPDACWLHQWKNAPLFLDKYLAFKKIKDLEGYREEVFREALQSNSKRIISEALDFYEELEMSKNGSFQDQIEAILFNQDMHHELRNKALQISMKVWNSNEALKHIMTLVEDPAEEVALLSLGYLYLVDYKLARDVSAQKEKNEHSTVISGLAELYTYHKVEGKFDFFKENVDKLNDIMDEYLMLSYMGNYAIQSQNLEYINYMVGLYEEVLKSECYMYMRIAAYKGLFGISVYFNESKMKDEGAYVMDIFNKYYNNEKSSTVIEYVGY